MKVTICVVALGGRYMRPVSRLINSLRDMAPEIEVQAWVNILPPGVGHIVRDGVDYTAYAAKPAVLDDLVKEGSSEAVILLDANFYAVNTLYPLVKHIRETGYYLCRNGYKVGEWATDACLRLMGMEREEAMEIDDVSSYCVGVHTDRKSASMLVSAWAAHCKDVNKIAGPHTNSAASKEGRNVGWCSGDPRCLGHRHDQTILSILRHRSCMNELCERPKFTAYAGSETAETCLIAHGMPI